MKFYYVYVLHNQKKSYTYIGYTENLQKRFSFHNSNSARATKPYQPLELIHYEAYRSKNDAKRREKYLKSSKGRTTLKTMLRDYLEQP
jgi:putative endonuclease